MFYSLQAILAVVSSVTLAVRAQSDSGALLPGGPLGIDDSVHGEQIGVGPEGTTYVFSNVVTETDDVPFTVTVVQDATHISEIVSATMSSDEDIENVGIVVQCGYPSGGTDSFVIGDCTMVENIVVGTFSTASTLVTSSVTLFRGDLAVSTASGASGSVQPTNAVTSTDANGSVVVASNTGTAASVTGTSNGAGRLTTGLYSVLVMFCLAIITA